MVKKHKRMEIITMIKNNQKFGARLFGLIALSFLLGLNSCSQNQIKNEELILLEAVLKEVVLEVTEDGSFDESRIIYFDTSANFDIGLTKSAIESYYEEVNDSIKKSIVRKLITGLNFENSKYKTIMSTPIGEEFEIITDYDRMVGLGESVLGSLRVSNIVIEGDLACFYLAFYCGNRCLGSGNIIFMQKEYGDWALKGIRPLWSSKPISGPGMPIN
ncbi:MAG: hypothetical protein ACJAXX_001788 [Roseivirga sp.]|jgi:hypothetical protein